MTPTYSELLPAPALRDRVHRYWFLRGDSRPKGPPEPIVPDGRPEIVFHFADPFRRLEERGAATQPRTLLAAQIDRPLRLEPCGALDVVGIRFRPFGAHAFVGAPLDRLVNATPALADVAPRLARSLESALLAAPRSTEGRARALDAALLEAAAPLLPRHDPRVAAAVELAGRARGAISIDAMACAAGLSGRQLERVFLREVGLAPKRFARIVRFQAVLRARTECGATAWAAIAHDLGYTDQAHLVRDFRAFAGVPPAAYFRTEHGFSEYLSAASATQLR